MTNPTKGVRFHPSRRGPVSAVVDMLDPEAHYVVADERPGGTEYDLLKPTVILSFSGLCLCRVPEPGGTSLWWMGQLDESDGSIVCWAPYSEDLGAAIRQL